MSRERKVPQASEFDAVELEQLLADVAPDERQRGAIREAHRQLEKDLLRLATSHQGS